MRTKSPNPIRLKYAELTGRRIAYCTETEFRVEVGKGRKGGYKTHYVFRGNLGKAVLYYDAINIGRSYKKRLVMPSSPQPVLHRQASY